MKSELHKLTEEFIIVLKSNHHDSIQEAWRNVHSYRRNLDALNIHYSWQHYELTRKIYEEWQKDYKRKQAK